MRRLRHTLRLGADETPASFASRLAALNGVSGRQFCMDMGTTFQKIVNGEPQALAMLATKSGADPDTLTGNAFVKTAERRYLHRGQELTRDNLRRATVVVCPHCLAEDLQSGPRSRPGTVAYQRVSWQVAPLKTCAIHLAPLAVVEKDMTPSTMHDWSHHVGKILPHLARLVAESSTRPLTGFETYVLDRINGRADGLDLIDAVPLHVAITACELFGAVASFGRRPNLKTLTDGEWGLAGAAGYAIFQAGKPGVDAFLEHLRDTYPYSRAGTEGPQAILGRIYQVLEFGREDKAYDPLRDLVGEFIRNRLPVGPGDVVFGKPVEQRTLHSVRTLSIETGLHPKRLRKLLSSAGLLAENSDALTDANCLFDAQKGSQAAGEASAASLSVRQAGEYLNAPRVQRDRLYQHGLIVPRIRAGDHGAADKFAPEDLDAFLDRLLAGAIPTDAAAQGQVSIPKAAKGGFVMSEDIVRLVLDGKLSRKWRLTSERGYMSLLIDVDEVRAAVRGPGHEGLVGSEIKDRLSTTSKVVAALIRHGHLSTVAVVNPVNRCPTTVVMPDELERFEVEYVSLFALARQQGRHHMAVKKALDAAGVKPALDPEKVGASFYLREELTGNFTRA